MYNRLKVVSVIMNTSSPATGDRRSVWTERLSYSGGQNTAAVRAEGDQAQDMKITRGAVEKVELTREIQIPNEGWELESRGTWIGGVGVLKFLENRPFGCPRLDG